jgi:hypothetical protein
VVAGAPGDVRGFRIWKIRTPPLGLEMNVSKQGGVEVHFSEREARELMRWIEAILPHTTEVHRSLLIRTRSKLGAARGIRLLPLRGIDSAPSAEKETGP